MKLFKLLLFAPFLFSCNSNSEESSIDHTMEGGFTQEDAEYLAKLLQIDSIDYDQCWQGLMNGKIPVYIHFKQQDDIVVGEITYLNTKAKTPIRLIGEFEDSTYRLLEFEKNGNVTGIITASIQKDHFKGDWFSPKSRKVLSLDLPLSDSVVVTYDNFEDPNDIYGSYHYQYSAEGYLGDLNFTKTKNNKSVFEINSVTGEPGRNMAWIFPDTIDVKGSSFNYHVPESDSCEVNVRFFKDFAIVKYTLGDCYLDFGHNATAEGIFLKVK